MYSSIMTRPDICYGLGILSRFQENRAERHWNVPIRLIKYIKSSVDMGLIFRKSENFDTV